MNFVKEGVLRGVACLPLIMTHTHTYKLTNTHTHTRTDELCERGSAARSSVLALYFAHDGFVGVWPLPLPKGAFVYAYI